MLFAAIARGHEQREVTDQEILERLLYPMINEGAKILDEGIAIRGSDVDVVWVNGYGWPLYRGGPMHWADSVGLAEIVDKIKDYGERLGGRHWELSPLLERLAATIRSLFPGRQHETPVRRLEGHVSRRQRIASIGFRIFHR